MTQDQSHSNIWAYYIPFSDDQGMNMEPRLSPDFQMRHKKPSVMIPRSIIKRQKFFRRRKTRNFRAKRQMEWEKNDKMGITAQVVFNIER